MNNNYNNKISLVAIEAV